MWVLCHSDIAAALNIRSKVEHCDCLYTHIHPFPLSQHSFMYDIHLAESFSNYVNSRIAAVSGTWLLCNWGF